MGNTSKKKPLFNIYIGQNILGGWAWGCLCVGNNNNNGEGERRINKNIEVCQRKEDQIQLALITSGAI